jgi:N-methylhydantoinase A
MCYGQGGSAPTTTDANLALGRLNPAYFLGGRIPLDPQAASDALATIGAHLGATGTEAVEGAAHAIVETANENMVNQIRLIAVERGLDPRAYVLVAFGGAGPVHASACARLLGMSRVLVPPHPGLSSAYGALAARLRVDRAWTIYSRSTDLPVEAISARLQQLTEDAVRELRDDGFAGDPIVLRSIDMRYAGQNYEREVAIPDGPFTAQSAAVMLDRFARAHEAFYGFMLEGEPVEFVHVRVVAIGAAQLTPFAEAPSSATDPAPVHHRPVAFKGGGYLDTPIFRRGDLPAGFRHPGPAVIEEADATTIVHPDDHFVVHANGLIELQVGT